MKEKLTFILPKGSVVTDMSELEYRIEGLIGYDSNSITYAATPFVMGKEINHRVVLKEFFLKSVCKRGADGMKMMISPDDAHKVLRHMKDFKMAAVAMKELSCKHSALATIRHIIDANNTIYCEMDHIEGGSLREWVEHNGGLKEREALRIVRPLAQALQVLHEGNWAYLNLTPDNIILSGNEVGKPVLTDFDEARELTPQGQHIHVDGGISHVIGFAPVEQYNETLSISPAMDVYSLGAILLYMLSGRVPPLAFDVNEEYIIRAVPIDTRASTCNAIVAAMKPAGEGRPKTIAELLAMLPEEEEEKPTAEEEPEELEELELADDYLPLEGEYEAEGNQAPEAVAAVGQPQPAIPAEEKPVAATPPQEKPAPEKREMEDTAMDSPSVAMPQYGPPVTTIGATPVQPSAPQYEAPEGEDANATVVREAPSAAPKHIWEEMEKMKERKPSADNSMGRSLLWVALITFIVVAIMAAVLIFS